MEKELTVTLTKMVKNSEQVLMNEIELTMQDEDELITLKTIELVKEDCDKKLLLIPDVIKGMLDEADNNAERISDKVLAENGILG